MTSTISKNHGRRALSALLSLVMCIGIFAFALPDLLPTANAAPAQDSYELKVTYDVTDKCDNEKYFESFKMDVTYRTNNGTNTSTATTTKTLAYSDVSSKKNGKTAVITLTNRAFPVAFKPTIDGKNWVHVGAIQDTTTVQIRKLEVTGPNGTTVTLWEGNSKISTNVNPKSFTINLEENSYSDTNDWDGDHSVDQANSVFSYEKPKPIATISGDTGINVPTNNSTAATSSVYTVTSAVDQYGNNWYSATPTLSLLDKDNNTLPTTAAIASRPITFYDKKVNVHSAANDRSNYKVTVQATVPAGSGTMVCATQKVTIRTFDYNVVFHNLDGSVLDTKTGVDYGTDSPLPTKDAIKAPTATGHYVFKQETGWKDNYKNIRGNYQTVDVYPKDYSATASLSGFTFERHDVNNGFYLRYRMSTQGHIRYCRKCLYELTSLQEHDWGDMKVYEEDTNLHYRTCNVCTFPDVHEMKKHDWDDGVITTQPGCETTGVLTVTCQTCGATQTQTIPATGHDWPEEWDQGDANQHVKTCKNGCGKVWKQDHDWDDGRVTTKPGCAVGQDGVRTYTCKDCDRTKTETIVAADHVWGKWQQIPASTTDETYKTKHIRYCENDNTHTEYGDHNFSSVRTVEPTCESRGYDLHTCDDCGYSYRDNYVTALGHDWTQVISAGSTHTFICSRNESHRKTGVKHELGDPVVTKEPTCGDRGTQERICSVCGGKVTESIPATGEHTYDLEHSEITKASTCTTKGTRVYTCVVCEKSRQTEELPIDPTAHRFGDWRDTGDKDQHIRTCIYNSKHVEKEAHSFTDVVAREATFTEPGILRHECKCGYYTTEIIPMKDRDYTPWAPDANGTTHSKHAVDDENFVVTEKHNWVEDPTGFVPATCGKNSFSLMRCADCGEEKTVEDYNTATGQHVWKEDASQHRDPTCGVAGQDVDVCDVCGNTRIRTIARTEDHVWVVDSESAATCTEDGLRISKCSVCQRTRTEVIETALGHIDPDHDGICNDCGQEVNPTQPTEPETPTTTQPSGGNSQSNGEKCRYCGKVHDDGLFGTLTKFFHNILAFFKRK